MTRPVTDTLPQPQTPSIHRFSSRALTWSGTLLLATVWTSAALFGLYILTFYAAALYQNNLVRWNQTLPHLFDPGSTAATAGIGLHFATGGIILLLGSIQLIKTVRERFPAAHRWIGRLYVLSSLLAAVGGLVFIALKGTIGGPVMNAGFGLYGILMAICSIETYRHAAAGQIQRHQVWALRLYSLAIGSWLYRMDYGFWFLLTQGRGHTSSFSGPFDQVMDFFFYLPNLLVAEAFSRAQQSHRSHRYQASSALRLGASLLLLGATGFLLIGTYYFTLYYWGPAIMAWLQRLQ